MNVTESNGLVLGEAIHQARENQTLSVAELAAQLKLPPEKLMTFESATDLVSLNAFDRGHLRNYAALLQVDLTPYELSDREQKALAAPLRSIQQNALDFEGIKWLKPMVVLLVFVLLAWGAYSGFSYWLKGSSVISSQSEQALSDSEAEGSVKTLPIEIRLPTITSEIKLENP
ncbi:MAG: helix-turn-helix domain-containing protein [Thiomicrospira sp.]|jgi:cytoskeleton protein RodZ|nr:helix-turn-helix domain-containing protein [Thiomicrospira sp.]